MNSKQTVEAYVTSGVKIKSYRLKEKLLDELLREPKCEECERKTWQGKSIPLDLHHKDNDHLNNPIDGSNWELLCPNCHAFKHRSYPWGGKKKTE